VALETKHRNPHKSSQLELFRPRLGSAAREDVASNDASAGAETRARSRDERRTGDIPEKAPKDEDQSQVPVPEGRDEPRNGYLRRHPFLSAIGLILLAVLIAAGYFYWDHTDHFESTDDAFVASRSFSIAPKVSGYITAVPVTDNEHVPAGGLIARIDDSEFRIALDQAEAEVSSAEAGVQNADAQLAVQQAQIASFEAQVDKAQAALELARVTWERDKPLVEKGWTTAQQGTIDVQNLKTQEASVKSAQADLELAQRQLDSLKAQRESAVSNLEQSKARRDQARLNLSYTTITADQPGHVVQLSAAVGGLAQPGTALAMFVPDQIWVAANFKEIQLDAIRPKQPVTIQIDAYPERRITGHVVSVQPGSGTAFALLPPQNATGNFVKIVQRVPVKILMDDPPSDVALGPGMSVQPTVRVDPEPSLYEQLPSIRDQLASLTGWLSGWF